MSQMAKEVANLIFKPGRARIGGEERLDECQLREVVPLLVDVSRAQRRRRVLIGAAALAALLLGATVFLLIYSRRIPAAPRNFLFAGYISDAAGRPLSGARVYAIGSDRNVSSGREGEFRYLLDRPEAVIRAELKGYLPDVATSKGGSSDLHLILRKLM